MSKTMIERKLRRKINPALVKTLLHTKKRVAWEKIAQLLASPRRKHVEKNLDEISRVSKEGDTLVIPGKVLGRGSVDKKIRVCAFSFSQEAIRKLKMKKCEIVHIIEEFQSNPKAQGVRVLR